MAANTKAQEALHQAFVKRLRASTACIVIGYIKCGEESGRKWAADEAEYLELLRIKKQANEGDSGLDDIIDYTPMDVLRRMTADLVTKTLERLLDPDAERDQLAIWDRFAADLSGEASAWFGLGFVHGATEVFEEAERKRRS